MKALLYCTRENPKLIKGKHEFYTTEARKDFLTPFQIEHTLNGYIVAECEIDKVGLIKANYYDDDFDSGISYGIDLRISNKFERDSCLSYDDLYNYLGGNHGYALHLSNIKVFDKPRVLNDFCLINQYRKDLEGTQYNLVSKAPQNMCNVVYSSNTIGKYPFYEILDSYILISIKPQWLCKILNGEKTIEVRKQILKCLKEMIE